MQRDKAELISDLPLWTPTHKHTSVDQPAKTCIHRTDTGYRQDDLTRMMPVGTDGKRETMESMKSAWLEDEDDNNENKQESRMTNLMMLKLNSREEIFNPPKAKQDTKNFKNPKRRF